MAPAARRRRGVTRHLVARSTTASARRGIGVRRLRPAWSNAGMAGRPKLKLKPNASTAARDPRRKPVRALTAPHRAQPPVADAPAPAGRRGAGPRPQRDERETGGRSRRRAHAELPPRRPDAGAARGDPRPGSRPKPASPSPGPRAGRASPAGRDKAPRAAIDAPSRAPPARGGGPPLPAGRAAPIRVHAGAKTSTADVPIAATPPTRGRAAAHGRSRARTNGRGPPARAAAIAGPGLVTRPRRDDATTAQQSANARAAPPTARRHPPRPRRRRSGPTRRASSPPVPAREAFVSRSG
jgi:hypothetical protein